jgi:ferredoxin
MRIIVNRDLCEGNGVCAQVAPEVFEVGDDDQVKVLVEQPGKERHAKIVEAVRRCPRQALAVEEG